MPSKKRQQRKPGKGNYQRNHMRKFPRTERSESTDERDWTLNTIDENKHTPKYITIHFWHIRDKEKNYKHLVETGWGGRNKWHKNNQEKEEHQTLIF